MLTVRKALAQDVARVREIAVAAYMPYLARIGRPPAPVTADYARAVARGEVWVAVRADVIIGLLVLVIRPRGLMGLRSRD